MLHVVVSFIYFYNNLYFFRIQCPGDRRKFARRGLKSPDPVGLMSPEHGPPNKNGTRFCAQEPVVIQGNPELFLIQYPVCDPVEQTGKELV